MQQQRGSSGFGQRPPQYPSSDRQPSFIDSDQYLRGGYFDGGHLRCELLTVDAKKVAEELQRSRPTLNYGQLRRFFAMIRYAELRLRAGRKFDEVKPQIYALSPAAADACNRQVAPPIFWKFVDKNVKYACQDERSFKEGFIQHFQSVICYYPRQSGQ